MRTRSQPVSPGGFVSLESMPPRRRGSRSTSAQPQEAEVVTTTEDSQPAEPKSPEVKSKTKATPKARKTHARKGSRAKKVRQSLQAMRTPTRANVIAE